jgi:WD40 repeat protein
VKVWDAATGQKTLSLKGHTDAVTSVALNPDGQRLASGSKENTIRVWDGSHASDETSVGFGAPGR